jgi:uncharacterized protein
MKTLHVVSFILVIIGGLNWLLVGLFSYDLVQGLLGFSTILVKLVYILVGLSAIYLIATHKKTCKDCVSGGNAEAKM